MKKLKCGPFSYYIIIYITTLILHLYNLYITIFKPQYIKMIDLNTKDVMQDMVMSFRANEPRDPIPHIYSFLKEVQKGVDSKEVKAITENELNELLNLKKKTEYYK